MAVICLALTGTAQALPTSPSERAMLFAACAGRFAAQETFWGQQPPADRDSDTFDTLTEAVLPAAIDYGMPPAVAQNAKFNAWRDHAYLRNDAEFSPDDGRRNRARDRLARELAECSDLIH
ncbi:hypothetical protein A8B82_19225 [Sulfitobacter sp. EhC04]|uniref:hypothetical protein n=1 Tax=Sulfitobacter sp. EhC04 TaxID=1849168 RepID=UPI0007F37595|nr:hypothetical protein [Sulfitobacter sp. EhC04]OAN73647.1 hypothetical protein A8B82_19225 [Sulfitobacter sp. EhC04]